MLKKHVHVLAGETGERNVAAGRARGGVMVTDTAFHRYPCYHTPLDTPDRIDYLWVAADLGNGNSA